MLELVLQNLTLIGYAVGLLALAMLSNTCFGIWYNVKELEREFDWHKLLEGSIKFIIFAIGLSALSTLITLLPAYLQYSGVELSEEVYTIADIVIVASIFITAIVRYTRQAIDKLRNILDGSDK